MSDVPLLELEDVHAFYGSAHILEGVDPEQVACGDTQELEAFGPGQGGGIGAVDGHRTIQCVEDVEGQGIGNAQPAEGVAGGDDGDERVRQGARFVSLQETSFGRGTVFHDPT